MPPPYATPVYDKNPDGSPKAYKNSGFTLIVVFTLALGVGANATIFSPVNDVADFQSKEI